MCTTIRINIDSRFWEDVGQCFMKFLGILFETTWSKSLFTYTFVDSMSVEVADHICWPAIGILQAWPSHLLAKHFPTERNVKQQLR